jgi:hypothetical protein
MTHKTVIDPKGWVRGVQPQNAGFGEMAAVVRWMGASERERAEWTRTGEWFGWSGVGMNHFTIRSSSVTVR